MRIKKGYIYIVNLDPTIGREIKKSRPCLVVSNNLFNKNSGLVTILPLTSKKVTKLYHNEIKVEKGDGGLGIVSKIIPSQVRTIDKKRIANELGKLSDRKFRSTCQSLKKHLGLQNL